METMNGQTDHGSGTFKSDSSNMFISALACMCVSTKGMLAWIFRSMYMWVIIIILIRLMDDDWRRTLYLYNL